jgi:hypothetical protein
MGLSQHENCLNMDCHYMLSQLLIQANSPKDAASHA